MGHDFEIIPDAPPLDFGLPEAPLSAPDLAADLSVEGVMQAGGWRTPTMVARYTEHLQARRGAMSKLAAKQGRI